MELLLRDARTLAIVTHATHAPVAGGRLTRYDVDGFEDHELARAFGAEPWEVVEVVPIDDRPGWVRVYAQPFEPVSTSWGAVGYLPR